jgi:hypothetical protein
MPKLPARTDTLEKVPPQYHELYEQRDGSYFLGIEGFEPHVLQERNRLKREKAELETAIAQYRELGDPESLARLKHAQQRLDDATLMEHGEVTKLLDSTKKQMNEEHTKQLTAAQKEAEQAKLELQSVLIDGEAGYALAAEGGIPELLMDVIRRRTKIMLEDGRHRAVVIGSDGQPRVKGNGEPFSIRELVQELRQDPTYRRAFDRPGASGSGAPPTFGGAGSGTLAAQREFLRKLPAAERLTRARQLGIK